jgi:hypothetical protein
MLSNAYLEQLKTLSANVDPPPWRAMWEGRDQESGDSFIMVGNDDERFDDFYVYREQRTASLHDLEFIAEARNAIPQLIDEIVRLRALLGITQPETG